MDAKKLLSEMLSYYEHKLDNNLCTMAEIESVTKLLQENMEINGTIEDFAKFYGVTETNVRATIGRKLIDKPKRVLLYPFHKFQKVIPLTWGWKKNTKPQQP